MRDLLDTKLDARFLEALKDNDNLDKAVSEWLGISPSEARRTIEQHIVNMMGEYTGASADVDVFRVLKDIKPDATLGDFLKVKFLVSKATAMECLEATADEGGAGWLTNALSPEEGKLLLILADAEGNVGALKASPDVIASVAEALNAIFKTKALVDRMEEAEKELLRIMGGLGVNEDEAEEDTPGEEDKDA